jgi:adenosylmethionine-8-amino-7-oxononanoate aminotransferase
LKSLSAMDRLAQLDHQFIWHPFTQMREWLKREPIVIVGGKGAVLRDARGREYLDANSSIWTNLHGHNQPAINAAIQRQLKKIAHSSALGLANEPASVLAGKLVQAANQPIFDLRFTTPMNREHAPSGVYAQTARSTCKSPNYRRFFSPTTVRRPSRSP